MQQRLHIVTLGVHDFQRSLQFYRDGLSWTPEDNNYEDIAFFPLGDVTLALYPRTKLAEDATVEPAGTGFSGITLSYKAKSKADVDAILKHVALIGGKIVKPAQDVFWGGYSGYFADPDGHLWEVAWSAAWDSEPADQTGE